MTRQFGVLKNSFGSVGVNVGKAPPPPASSNTVLHDDRIRWSYGRQ